MLTLVEKILFGLAVVATMAATYFAIKRLIGIITDGQGRPDWKLVLKRLVGVLPKIAPYLTLMTEDALQQEHSLREVFNVLRYIVRTGMQWRMIPSDLLPGLLRASTAESHRRSPAMRAGQRSGLSCHLSIVGR
jgi:transposase